MEKLRATPAARALAKKLDLDLSLIEGTGAKGRIHKEDVQNYKEELSPRISPLAKKIAEAHQINIHEVKGSGYRGKIMKEDILALLTPKSVKDGSAKESVTVQAEKEADSSLASAKASLSNVIPQDNLEEIIPMSPMRNVISKRMSESAFTAPTFTLNYEVDMTEILALRQKLIDPIMAKTECKLTVTDLISLAVIKNLMKEEHKFINSSLSEDGKQIIVHRYVNLAMAVGLQDGLLTPVVKNAHQMSLSELVVGLKTMVKKAQQMKLKPDELAGSTFTISNLGMFGVKSFNPIINQPNSAILGIAATTEKPVVRNGEIVIRPIMEMCLTVDHRVVDGMNGAKFMVDLKKTLENPMELFI